MLRVGNLRLHAHSFVFRKRVENPHNVELFLALGIVHGGDVDAVIELLFIAKHLKNRGNQRAIHLQIVLAKIGQRLDAGAELLGQLGNQRRVPRLGSRSGGLCRCCGLGGRCSGCRFFSWRGGFRRSRSWRHCGLLRWRGRFGTTRRRSSGRNAAGNLIGGGLFSLRLRRRRFGFVRHS